MFVTFKKPTDFQDFKIQINVISGSSGLFDQFMNWSGLEPFKPTFGLVNS